MKKRFYLNASQQRRSSTKANAEKLVAHAEEMRKKMLSDFPDWRVRFAFAIENISSHSSERGCTPFSSALQLLGAKFFDPAIRNLILGIGLHLTIEAEAKKARPVPPDESTYADEIEEDGIANPPAAMPEPPPFTDR